MTQIYVVARMVEGEMQQRKEILDAIMMDDWYTGELSALATMDQWNHHFLEDATQEEYEAGDFLLLGTFRMSLEGLVGTYDS